MTTTRLSKQHWLDAGFDALLGKGPAALAAEPLARQLGTTKGSFYWHFKDVPAFHAAMTSHWRSGALSDLSTSVATGGAPDQRLRTFGYALLHDPTEAAMRTWAQSNVDVAKALHIVDDERLTYLTLLLREMGLGNADFARALQATLVGLPHLDENAETRRAPFDALVDTVLAL